MAQRLWSLQHPANLAFARHVTFDRTGRFVYIASGHGQPFAAIRFLKVCALTGSVVAQARLRDEARCWHIERDRVFVATAKRLFVLQEGSLEVVSEWRKNVPQYANYSIPTASHIVLGCADDVVRFTNEQSKAIRRRAPGLSGVFAIPDSGHLLICSGEEGEIRSLHVEEMSFTIIHKAQPFYQACASADVGVLALSQKDRPRTPNRVQFCYLHDRPVRERTVELPEQLQRIQLSDDGKILFTFIDNLATEWSIEANEIKRGRHVQLPEGSYIITIDPCPGRLVAWRQDGEGGVFEMFVF